MRVLQSGIIMVMILFLFFGCGAVAEEFLCVTTEEFAVLLTMNGDEVVTAGEYDEFFCIVPGELYAGGRKSEELFLYDLLDESGNVVSDQPCEMYAPSGDKILFRLNGLYGAMDSYGNILIPERYTQLVSNENGGWFALATDPNDDDPDQILLIDAAGEVLQSGVYTVEGLKKVTDGRMLFCSPDTEKYGYLDEKGGIAIEAKLSYAGAFSGGMARAAQDGLFGVLSASGDWTVQPRYSYIELGPRVILGMLGRKTCIVWDAMTCTELFRVDGMGLSAAIVGEGILISDESSVRLYGADGSLLLEGDADVSVTPGAGDQLLFSDGEWGTACVSIVNADGTRFSRLDQHLLPLDDERYAFMTMNVAAYNSQALGEIRYSGDYDSIRYGMLDRNGMEILPAEYLDITCIGENRYLTVAEDGYRVIDGEGTVLWSCIEEEEPSA